MRPSPPMTNAPSRARARAGPGPVVAVAGSARRSTALIDRALSPLARQAEPAHVVHRRHPNAAGRQAAVDREPPASARWPLGLEKRALSEDSVSGVTHGVLR